MIRCRIVLEYRDERSALSIYRAVEPENKGYVHGKIQGNTVIFEISGEEPMSLSHTINDLLACVRAAESTLM